MDQSTPVNAISISIFMIDPRSETDSLRNLDSRAVSAVYNQYFPELLRYVCYRLGDEVLAEDIVSEVFVRLLKAVKARRGPERNLRGWLISTAQHLVIDQLRQKYRHPVETISDMLPTDAGGPQDEVERRDNSTSLHLALSQLTEVQQHVLALRFGQRCSIEETAAIMKKNVPAVKALQLRALSVLQRKIRDSK
jgi:RNA polymerase sigma-70 factor, ECF subfamily